MTRGSVGLTILLLIVLASCVTQRGTVAVVRTAEVPRREVLLYAIPNDDPIAPIMKSVSDYAMLASMAYVDGSIPIEGTCLNVAAWQRDTDVTLGLPERASGKADIPGLGFSVWIKRGSPQHVAIVFRGTDFDQWGDWYSNLRWVTRLNVFTRDQYAQVRALMPELHRRISHKYGSKTEVIAVGHSLGGGLAQQAAYADSWIKKVYAFNTTPVTGFSSVASKSEFKQGVQIYRPYESGEILANIRYVGRRVMPLSRANPHVTEIRFNFRRTFKEGSQGGGPIGQHRMRQLACDLVCWLDKQGGEACAARSLP